MVVTVPTPVICGTGVLLINPYKQILIAKQKTGRVSTGRGANQESIPLETQKIINGLSENPDDTLRNGAMAEVVNDATLDLVGRNSFYVVPVGNMMVASKTTQGTLGIVRVVVYDGDLQYPFTTAHPEEIGDIRWIDPGEFVVKQDIQARPLAKEIVMFALQNELLDQALSLYRDGLSEPLFPKDFSIDAVHSEREKHPDRV